MSDIRYILYYYTISTHHASGCIWSISMIYINIMMCINELARVSMVHVNYPLLLLLFIALLDLLLEFELELPYKSMVCLILTASVSVSLGFAIVALAIGVQGCWHSSLIFDAPDCHWVDAGSIEGVHLALFNRSTSFFASISSASKSWAGGDMAFHRGSPAKLLISW